MEGVLISQQESKGYYFNIEKYNDSEKAIPCEGVFKSDRPIIENATNYQVGVERLLFPVSNYLQNSTFNITKDQLKAYLMMLGTNVPVGGKQIKATLENVGETYTYEALTGNTAEPSSPQDLIYYINCLWSTCSKQFMINWLLGTQIYLNANSSTTNATKEGFYNTSMVRYEVDESTRKMTIVVPKLIGYLTKVVNGTQMYMDFYNPYYYFMNNGQTSILESYAQAQISSLNTISTTSYASGSTPTTPTTIPSIHTASIATAAFFSLMPNIAAIFGGLRGQSYEDFKNDSNLVLLRFHSTDIHDEPFKSFTWVYQGFVNNTRLYKAGLADQGISLSSTNLITNVKTEIDYNYNTSSDGQLMSSYTTSNFNTQTYSTFDCSTRSYQALYSYLPRTIVILTTLPIIAESFSKVTQSQGNMTGYGSARVITDISTTPEDWLDGNYIEYLPSTGVRFHPLISSDKIIQFEFSVMAKLIDGTLVPLYMNPGESFSTKIVFRSAVF